MLRVETAADFVALRPALEPVTITSRTHGAIPVPCMTTLLVRAELVVENLYNPNSVPPDKMELLQQSILDNGVAFPVVTVWDDDQQKFVVVDGAHRTMMLGVSWLDCDYIPVVVLPHGVEKRLAATWQFNKARGVHQVDLDADLIRRLVEQGLSDDEIAVRLGVDTDTVFRYKQVTGIAELFRGAEWSSAWEVDDEAETAEAGA